MPILEDRLEGRLHGRTDVALLEKLLIDLGLAQNEEAVRSAITRHLE